MPSGPNQSMETTALGIPIPDALPEDGLLLQLKTEAEKINDLIGAVAGPMVLSADATAVSSNSLTAQTGLSKNVVSGTVYVFTIILWITATLAEGWQLDLNGGSATVSWIKAVAKGYDDASPGSLALVSTITTLATNVSPQDGFSGIVEIEGSFVPSADGTVIPRIAQTAHGSGSVQILKGSSISLE